MVDKNTLPALGTLTLCGTPIGNLEDITLRVLRVLKEVDIIAAEDTRHTRQLLHYYDIHCPLVSYHEHNRFEKGQQLVKLLQEGKNIALVTDAGMPGISDPGWDLVRLCRQVGVPVTAAPGPTAAITGLVLSGLSTERFVFEGFLPKGKKERGSLLENLRWETRTTVLYEAPHRLLSTLKVLEDVLEDRRVCAVRELTKKYEEVIDLPIQLLREYFQNHEPRGEFVLVIEGATQGKPKEQEASWQGVTIADHIARYEQEGHDKKAAMKLVAQDRGVSKRDIYKEALAQKERG